MRGAFTGLLTSGADCVARAKDGRGSNGSRRLS